MVELLAVRGIEKLSPAGRAELVRVAERLGGNPDFLAAVISFESAGSFDPSQKNLAGGTAMGLIQFMPYTAKLLDTTTGELAAMTVVEQLQYVERYYRLAAPGGVRTLADHYLAVLAPKGVGKSPGFAVYKQPGRAYTANQALDFDGDGRITVHEASTPVRNIVAAARGKTVTVDMSATEAKRGRTVVEPPASSAAGALGALVSVAPPGRWRRLGIAAAGAVAAFALVTVIRGRDF